jgi:hypothetical protein
MKIGLLVGILSTAAGFDVVSSMRAARRQGTLTIESVREPGWIGGWRNLGKRGLTMRW